MSQLYINPITAYYDTNGEPLSGGKINFYDAGTLNPLAVYTDQALIVAHSNPIILDADGRASQIWMQDSSYKVILTDSADVVIQTEDNLDFTNSATFDSIKQSATTSYQGVVELATVAEAKAGSDTERAVTPEGLNAAISEQSGVAIGYMSSFIPSNDADADHDILFGTGTCKSASNNFTIVSSTALTKQIDADWTVGDDVGGMPATVAKTGTFTTITTAVTGIGSLFLTEFSKGDILYSDDKVEGRRVVDVINDTSMTLDSAFATDVAVADDVKKNALTDGATYHLHVLFNTGTGDTDYGFDTSTSAVNLLLDAQVISAGFTEYRRVGSILTDASSNVLPFTVLEKAGGGLDFLYDTSIQDALDISNTTLTVDISIPTGLELKPKISYQTGCNSLNTVLSYAIQKTNSLSVLISAIRSSSGTQTKEVTIMESVYTNTLGQIDIQSAVSHFVTVNTFGYTDERL